ncbi:hypothetical protein A2797_02170 [candidate division WWE3 bacterium RIFCSPHIGHO2_01_FULL_48_15]|uniref:Aspartyl/glutamyl-tRNA(Asn/Gln) amidotransferase subunit B n=1 Tax=candidate division WWE3 bacterium RIFCSPHIGHO2_01_FULL_48_15 TaxID=1802619 RepID=A0A1F4VG78_UNCKA|nr:MAG: hypothetical protein A2797_02170 [candidate division WWE3 bacterium RIFCSPHIGHO2_01_FULL_48_15]
MTTYEPVIGLEIHTQVKTQSKMFCGCPADVFGKEPNTATCPVCLALPGALPVPNIEAVKKTVTLAKALGCEITSLSQFERKNYFYPDLPKGYQISQYVEPIGKKGKFEGAEITRVHLEEDTGRLLHKGPVTLVDFNRSGIPLIEIVTEPVFSDPETVGKFLKELRTNLVHFEISAADMEEGSLRLEANVSLRKAGERQLPDYRVELKNINSFAFLVSAVKGEIERQKDLLEKGEKVTQETRGWDEKQGITVSQRKKEEAFDYRYFPEPDIPPLTKKILIGEKKRKTPGEIRQEYSALGLSAQYISVFLADLELAYLFEELRKEIPAQEAANILVNKRFGDPEKLGISGLLAAYHAEEKKEFVLGGDLRQATEKIVLDNPSAVGDYTAGKESALEFLLGQLMKAEKGRIKPEEGREILKNIIHARS